MFKMDKPFKLHITLILPNIFIKWYTYAFSEDANKRILRFHTSLFKMISILIAFKAKTPDE